MELQLWILPILIGLISAILLLSILFNDKQNFADLGTLIQLQTSRPYYYTLEWMPINYNVKVSSNPTQGQITNTSSPLWMNGINGLDSKVSYPIYNYYEI